MELKTSVKDMLPLAICLWFMSQIIEKMPKSLVIELEPLDKESVKNVERLRD